MSIIKVMAFSFINMPYENPHIFINKNNKYYLRGFLAI